MPWDRWPAHRWGRCGGESRHPHRSIDNDPHPGRGGGGRVPRAALPVCGWGWRPSAPSPSPITHPSFPLWKRVSAIARHHPRHGISAELRGCYPRGGSLPPTGHGPLLRLAPCPTNRRSSLSLHHAVGSAAAGSMDALLPCRHGRVDGHGSNGRRFKAQPAYGSPPPMTNSP